MALPPDHPRVWERLCRLGPPLDPSSLRTALAACARTGVWVCFRGEEDYPPLLQTIPDPPELLFLRGRPSVFSGPCMAVVGSRHPTPYGRRVARDLAWDLARAGFTVVSGLARGIDRVAHETALEAGGSTLAVLGCGIDVVYPPEHQGLMERIAREGALCTEFPPGTPPRARHFPRRNRILSGLCLGVVVVEATERSGALITARLALDQGREVFAVPGPIISPLSRGTHLLLRQGAALVEGLPDILEALPPLELTIPFDHDTRVNSQENLDPGARISGDARKVLEALSDTEPRHLDDLVQQTGLPPSRLAIVLMELELDGWIQQEQGQTYLRTIQKRKS